MHRWGPDSRSATSAGASGAAHHCHLQFLTRPKKFHAIITISMRVDNLLFTWLAISRVAKHYRWGYPLQTVHLCEDCVLNQIE